MSDTRLSDILTFADARTIVEANVVPREPGALRTLPDGYESDAVFRVLIEWQPGYEFDAPVILVEKATGHVERWPWVQAVSGPYDPDKMRPVSSA